MRLWEWFERGLPVGDELGRSTNHRQLQPDDTYTYFARDTYAAGKQSIYRARALVRARAGQEDVGKDQGLMRMMHTRIVRLC